MKWKLMPYVSDPIDTLLLINKKINVYIYLEFGELLRIIQGIQNNFRFTSF